MRISLATLAALVASACGDYVRRGSPMMDLDERRQLNTSKAYKKKGKMEKQTKPAAGSLAGAATKPPKNTQAGAQSKNDQPTDAPIKDTPMETISLGNKRPEGITRGPGDTMFVSEMLYGGIKKVNVLTGKIKQVVPSYGYKERGAYGVIQHKKALFVAGGGVPDGTPTKMYVYNATSGEEIAACDPAGISFLLNDVAILGNYAYVTDSYYNKLMVVNVNKALRGECDVFSIKTPGVIFKATHWDILEYNPRATGIIAYDKGLIIARTAPGGLYFLDLDDEDMPTMELASQYTAPRNDGLAVADGILYAAENTLNSISVWSLDETLDSRTVMREDDPLQFLGRLRLDVSSVDFPAKVEIYTEKYLCAVDARLKSLPVSDEEGTEDFKETFNMMCVGRMEVDE